MKKLLVLLMCAVFFIGCAGTTVQSVPPKVDQIVDVAFVALLISQPELKPEIVTQLKNVKALMSTDITYNFLLSDLSARFAGKYAPLVPLLIEMFNADAPMSKDWLTMFDGQKAIIATKIDHLLMLAGA